MELPMSSGALEKPKTLWYATNEAQQKHQKISTEFQNHHGTLTIASVDDEASTGKFDRIKSFLEL